MDYRRYFQWWDTIRISKPSNELEYNLICEETR